VDLRGFEPLTSSMPLRRAANCATGPRYCGRPGITAGLFSRRHSTTLRPACQEDGGDSPSPRAGRQRRGARAPGLGDTCGLATLRPCVESAAGSPLAAPARVPDPQGAHLVDRCSLRRPRVPSVTGVQANGNTKPSAPRGRHLGTQPAESLAGLGQAECARGTRERQRNGSSANSPGGRMQLSASDATRSVTRASRFWRLLLGSQGQEGATGSRRPVANAHGAQLNGAP
jgi:hypothetical protein